MKKIKTLYCEECGQELIDKYVFHGYDSNTGDKLFIVKSRCPAKKWYNMHSNFTRGEYDGNLSFHFYIEREKKFDTE